jgi:RNA polymerase sigma-70 factor (ECF subfamily)
MDKLESLLHIYQNALLKECWKFYKQRSDVWDLLQDASIKMAKSFHTFDQSKNFLPWARRVILTTHEDHKRAKDKEFGEYDLCYRQNLEKYAIIEPEVEESATQLLKQLPPEEAALLEAVFIDGIAQTSMAKILGVSQQAISKRVAKAKENLKEILNEGTYDT